MAKFETIYIKDPASECMTRMFNRLRDISEDENVLAFVSKPLMEAMEKCSTEIDASYEYEGQSSHNFVTCRRFFEYVDIWFAPTTSKDVLPLVNIVGMKVRNAKNEKKNFKTEKLKKIIIFDLK